MLRHLIVATTLLVATTTTSAALEIDIEVFDARPVQEITIQVTLSGEIREGDADRLKAALADHDHLDMRDILFLLDSPGGNLFEGMLIGEVIAQRDEITSAQVGTLEQPDGICASACVMAYLGADYRYLGGSGRIGVHQFSAPGSQMSGSEAISQAQSISAILVNYIRQQRADPAFYERMSTTRAEEIDWVPRPLLEEWRVVTGSVYDEEAEYRNVNGEIGLELTHSSVYGINNLLMVCGKTPHGQGIIGIANLHEPGLTAYGDFQVSIDSDTYSVDNWEIVERDSGRGRIAFTMPEHLEGRMVAARDFGVRVVLPSEEMFFGFHQKMRDDKLGEFVTGCVGNPGQQMSMKIMQNTDLAGDDLTDTGIRGISFSACRALCMEEPRCAAVSYVQAKEWCWPKFGSAGARYSSGIISAVKPR